MAFHAKYKGTCRSCGEEIEVGQYIKSNRGRGYSHVNCPSDSNSIPSSRMSRADAEYAAGKVEVDRWRSNVAMFGEEYAAAEELAWDMKMGWD